MGAVMTAVVVDGPKGKEYRLPTDHEVEVAGVSEERLQALYADIPFGPAGGADCPKQGTGASRAFSVDGYGFDTWRKLFTNRQLLALGRVCPGGPLEPLCKSWTTSLMSGGKPFLSHKPLITNLALVTDRLADYSSAICSWRRTAFGSS